MWWLYQALYALLLLLLGPFFLLLRGRHYREPLAARLSPPRTLEGAGGLWIHAVSVGEVAVAATLAKALPSALPLVVTTVTPTGQERARRALAGRAAVAYLPFELGYAVRRFFDAARPRALVLIEGDYWPRLLAEARRRSIPVVVVNGRVSDRSFPRLRLVRRWVQRLLLEPVVGFGVQSPLDGDRLHVLGAPRTAIVVTGNLKFEAPEPPVLPELDRLIATLAAGRPLIVAGSTMPGEEEKLFAAYAEVAKTAAFLLVVAPRHPERFQPVAEMVEKRFPGALRRSRVDADLLARIGRDAAVAPPVLLLDSLGELAALYRHATVAFVGGTLVHKGGHNPIEAARFGVPVVVGRSMSNFREIAEAFDRAGAWERVDGAVELGKLWQRWLLNPESAAEVGRRGRDLVDANRGALERTLELVRPLVATAGDAPA
jgi:3-deoxy-D-manno-octulosonic-acid transferase